MDDSVTAYGPRVQPAGRIKLIIGRLVPTPSMVEDLPANSNRPTFCCFCRKDISVVPVDEQLNYNELGGILAPVCEWCAKNGEWNKATAAVHLVLRGVDNEGYSADGAKCFRDEGVAMQERDRRNEARKPGLYGFGDWWDVFTVPLE